MLLKHAWVDPVSQMEPEELQEVAQSTDLFWSAVCTCLLCAGSLRGGLWYGQNPIGWVPQTSKALLCFLDTNKGDTEQKGLIVQVRCAAAEPRSSKRRRGKCLHLPMRVSLRGWECKHAHSGGKTFQENHRISTTRLQGKEVPRSLN